MPVVNIGTRQNNRQRGKNVVDVDYNSDEILKAINYQVKHGAYKTEFVYGDGLSGEKISNVLTKCDLKLDKIINF